MIAPRIVPKLGDGREPGRQCAALVDAASRWLSSRAKDKVFDQEMFLWEKDPDNPDSEVFGGLSRVRLEQGHQRIVTRIAEFIRRPN
jgi:hypothetical protein